MIPIPHDPLALPYSNKSDPLRGPIFIPLNVEPLMKNKSHLFEGNINESLMLSRYLIELRSISLR